MNIVQNKGLHNTPYQNLFIFLYVYFIKMSFRKIYLVYFPRVKESFPDIYSEAFGLWSPLAIGSMQLFKSIQDLNEGVKNYIKRNNHVSYTLSNEIPSQHEFSLSENMYTNLFRYAQPLTDEDFNEIMLN